MSSNLSPCPISQRTSTLGRALSKSLIRLAIGVPGKSMLTTILSAILAESQMVCRELPAKEGITAGSLNWGIHALTTPISFCSLSAVERSGAVLGAHSFRNGVRRFAQIACVSETLDFPGRLDSSVGRAED
jgi:hypothetical protein